jgi:enoyl-CoA hydratase
MPQVEYEVRDRIAYITMNRPEKLNAMTHEMLRGLWDAFTKVRDDDEVWLGIVTGEGRAFSVGHDLVEMSAGGKMADTPGSTDELYLFMATQVWKPIIAAVNGICLAQGAGVALGADIRVVADNVQFGWPQVKRGISSISGPVILSQRVPIGKALEILLTGDFIGAHEALELGLVNYVVPAADVMPKAEELASKILVNAPLAVRGMKEAAVRGLDLPLRDRLEVATKIYDRLQDTEDAAEGLAAFNEKRPTVFRGR